MFFIRLLSWLHCAFLAASSLTDCFPPCFLHLGYHWSLCLAQLTPAYGVTSMPIHPGCHRPFTRSVVRRSVADACRGLALCFLFLISAFYFHVRHPRSSLLQHVITPSVFTLRPFALYLSSWRVLVAYAFRTSLGIKLRPVFILIVEGGGLEPPAHPRLFGESPPLWSDAVAFISVGVRDYSPYSKLPVCSIVSGFFLPCIVVLIF